MNDYLPRIMFLLLLVSGFTQADSPAMTTGPVIEGYGPVFAVEPEYNLLPDTQYRVVFDLSSTQDESGALNRSIESAARFLNMHARNGIDPDNLEVALVVHGGAGKDMLSNAAYRSRYGVDNPNAGLLQALREANVQIWLCGQTAAARGFARDELHPAVGVSLSAMTVLTRLQTEGWAILPW